MLRPSTAPRWKIAISCFARRRRRPLRRAREERRREAEADEREARRSSGRRVGTAWTHLRLKFRRAERQRDRLLRRRSPSRSSRAWRRDVAGRSPRERASATRSAATAGDRRRAAGRSRAQREVHPADERAGVHPRVGACPCSRSAAGTCRAACRAAAASRTSGSASCTSAPVARSGADDELERRLHLRAVGVRRRGTPATSGSSRITSRRSPSVVAEPRGGAIDERRRRRVADEAPRQLGRDEARRRRMRRQDVEHLLAVALAAAGLDHVAEHDLLAGVVQARLEAEAAALARIRRSSSR